MNNDRFKYRVWSPNVGKYYPKDSHIAIPQSGKPIIYTFFENDCDEPPIIEQCTGFKDKNGKLIFEGDVLCYADSPQEREPVIRANSGEYLIVGMPLLQIAGELTILGTIHDEEEA